MGLKQDLIDAKKKAAVESKQPPLEVEEGDNSYIDKEAQYTADAIVKFLSEAKFRVTKLKAPVTVEELDAGELPVDIELETLLGEYQPVLKTLKQLGDPLGLGALIDRLEGDIEKAVQPLVEGGAKMLFKIGTAQGGLKSKGYVNVGENPDSVDNFNVDDESGQREHTEARFFIEDNEELL